MELGDGVPLHKGRQDSGLGLRWRGEQDERHGGQDRADHPRSQPVSARMTANAGPIQRGTSAGGGDVVAGLHDHSGALDEAAVAARQGCVRRVPSSVHLGDV